MNDVLRERVKVLDRPSLHTQKSNIIIQSMKNCNNKQSKIPYGRIKRIQFQLFFTPKANPLAK
jgi:hypothetical protein